MCLYGGFAPLRGSRGGLGSERRGIGSRRTNRRRRRSRHPLHPCSSAVDHGRVAVETGGAIEHSVEN